MLRGVLRGKIFNVNRLSPKPYLDVLPPICDYLIGSIDLLKKLARVPSDVLLGEEEGAQDPLPPPRSGPSPHSDSDPSVRCVSNLS